MAPLLTNATRSSEAEFVVKVARTASAPQQTTTDDTPSSQGLQLVEQSKPNVQDVKDQERAENMERWWNTAMKEHMNQSDGYKKAAVLLVKWADELDKLRTRSETEELDALFRDRFNYQTKIVELNVRTKPQHQLSSHITEFIQHHDGPRNLLIIYYTGHGWFREDKNYLELSANRTPDQCKGITTDAIANWNKAEEVLKSEDVDGDVLTILDTCYASNHVKSGELDPKKFQLLSACAKNQTTEAPGKLSFTRALIDVLHKLLDENKDHASFSTFRIMQHINLDPRRTDNPSQLWNHPPRNEHHISLAPIKSSHIENLSMSNLRQPPGGLLTLRFGLRDASLNQEQIEFMTRTIAKALNNKKLIGLKEVKWVKMRPAPTIPLDRVAVVIYVIRVWKRVVARKKETRALQEASSRSIDDVRLPDAMDLCPTTSQKRSQEDLNDLPNAKRQYLSTSQPPSPPVSNSSAVDY